VQALKQENPIVVTDDGIVIVENAQFSKQLSLKLVILLDKTIDAREEQK